MRLLLRQVAPDLLAIRPRDLLALEVEMTIDHHRAPARTRNLVCDRAGRTHPPSGDRRDQPIREREHPLAILVAVAVAARGVADPRRNLAQSHAITEQPE